jgi:hypothetical protein
MHLHVQDSRGQPTAGMMPPETSASRVHLPPVDIRVAGAVAVEVAVGGTTEGWPVLGNNGEGRRCRRRTPVGPHLERAGPWVCERGVHDTLTSLCVVAVRSRGVVTVRRRTVATLASARMAALPATTLATTAAVSLASWLAGLTGARWSRGLHMVALATSRRHGRRGNEGRRRGRWEGVDVDLLKEQVHAGLGKRRKRTLHLQNRHHVTKFTTESAKEGEHHLAVTDGIAEFGERRSHGLQLAAKAGDRHGVLAEVAELCFQEKGMRLLLVEEFVLKVAPRLACVAWADHERLLEVAGDGGEDP